jgi:hypothetical protein
MEEQICLGVVTVAMHVISLRSAALWVELNTQPEHSTGHIYVKVSVKGFLHKMGMWAKIVRLEEGRLNLDLGDIFCELCVAVVGIHYLH